MIVGPTVIMNPDYINLKQTSHLSDYPAFLRIDYTTVPLGDWLERKKVPAIIIKQQFGFPMSTT